MTQNNEKSVVNITVNIAGVQEANQLVERLCESQNHRLSRWLE